MRSARFRGAAADSVRAFMEPRFNADFSAVRVHADANARELARSVNAHAFTVGSNVAFAAGQYAPNAEAGKRLLAHELTHVVQQGGAVNTAGISRAVASGDSTVVQRDFDPERLQSPLDPLQERRLSLGTGWYVEMDPATPVVAAGAQVAFHLRNSQEYEIDNWEEEAPGAGKRPLFVLVDAEHHMKFGRTTNIKPYHAVFRTTLDKPRKYRATFLGHPKLRTHGGGATIDGPEVRVSVDFDVAADLSFEKLNGKDIEATSARDLQHLEDPNATEGELFAAFERLAVRHAFKVLEDNRKEAEEQLALYTKGAAGKTGAQATDELKRIVDVDDQLHWAEYRLRRDAGYFRDKLVPRAKNLGRDPIALQKEELQRIVELRTTLIQAFPSLAFVRRDKDQAPYADRDNKPQWNFRRQPGERASVIQCGLRRVLADIEKAKRQLATGELSILKAAPILAATRQALGIDADPHASKAIDRQMQEHGAADWKTDLAIGGAQLLLLFVPGSALISPPGSGSWWPHVRGSASQS